MSSTRTIITGPPPPQDPGLDQLPVRKEINDFIADPKQWSLYIRALAELQRVPQSESVSFFQISAIHGLPAGRWEESGPEKAAGFDGYCTHGLVLFPTWHRIYMSLYEQIIQKLAAGIAANDTDDWKKAADGLRQPYWDWARNAIPPPEVIEYTTLEILMPDGSTKTVDNPLYNYTFHPMDSGIGRRYINFPSTLRTPIQQGMDPKDNVEYLKRRLSSAQENFRRSVYSLLSSRRKDWVAFSSHFGRDGKYVASSLEGIHDQLHGTVNGHMGDPNVAAFDPIFYLHHCNVDRLLALWQGAHPDVWVTPGKAGPYSTTRTISENQLVDSTTPLTPFWNGDESTLYWTSALTRDWTRLGYTYPEFEGLNLSDQASVKRAITIEINRLYKNPKTTAPRPVFADLMATSAVPIDVKTDAVETRGARAPGAGEAEAQPDYEWVSRVQVQHHALGGSFGVCLFLVPDDQSIPEDVPEWYSSPYFVGEHIIFASTQMEGCSNCQQQAAEGAVNEGFIPLTSALTTQFGLQSTEPDTVGPYLKKHLAWKVHKLDDEVIPCEQLPSLEVTVLSSRVYVSESRGTSDPEGAEGAEGADGADEDSFPDLGTPQEHREITVGKLGGARE